MGVPKGSSQRDGFMLFHCGGTNNRAARKKMTDDIAMRNVAIILCIASSPRRLKVQNPRTPINRKD